MLLTIIMFFHISQHPLDAHKDKESSTAVLLRFQLTYLCVFVPMDYVYHYKTTYLMKGIIS